MSKIKKNLTLLVLVLLLAGCSSVLASMPYTFVLAELNQTGYSEIYTKTLRSECAYIQQIGTSPGNYTISYTIVTDNGQTNASETITIWNTDYIDKRVPYLSSYVNSYPKNMQVKGYYRGSGPVTINGIWNPVDDFD